LRQRGEGEADKQEKESFLEAGHGLTSGDWRGGLVVAFLFVRLLLWVRAV
jgi:hypothetical protein